MSAFNACFGASDAALSSSSEILFGENSFFTKGSFSPVTSCAVSSVLSFICYFGLCRIPSNFTFSIYGDLASSVKPSDNVSKAPDSHSRLLIDTGPGDFELSYSCGLNLSLLP